MAGIDQRVIDAMGSDLVNDVDVEPARRPPQFQFEPMIQPTRSGFAKQSSNTCLESSTDPQFPHKMQTKSEWLLLWASGFLFESATLTRENIDAICSDLVNHIDVDPIPAPASIPI
jgi:hypothetical protein